MKTIKTPNFTGKIAKTIAEICTKTSIDAAEAEVMKEILNDMLIEKCRLLAGYYEEEYYNALNTARNRAYDAGFDEGYDVGYDVGHSESHSAV